MKSVFAGERYGYLTLLLIVAMIVCGCENTQPTRLPNNGIKASVEGGGDFPEFLVGTWKADKFKFEITFGPNGNVSSLRHPFGMLIDMEDAAFYEEGDDGLYAYYFMAPCKVRYNPKNRQLNVDITMEHFHMVLPNGVLEGKALDFYKGPVSPDGKTWDVQWVSTGDIIDAPPKPDPNDVTPVPFKFIKAG